MNGLIVAAVAGVAGIAGVVGLSGAATGGEGAPATTVPAIAVTSTAPETLSSRLDRLRAAERAADDALGREMPATTTSSAPVTAPLSSRSSDDDGTLDQGSGDRDPITGARIDDDGGDDHGQVGDDDRDDGDNSGPGRDGDDDHGGQDHEDDD